MPRVYTRREVITVVGPSIAYVPLTQGFFALIDSENASSIGVHTWTAVTYTRGQKKFIYAYRGVWNPQTKKTKQIALHVFLGKRDHISGNTLDNRACNLREASPKENARNARIRVDNTSGLKGVFLRGSKFRAMIRVDGKLIHLGTHLTAEEAHGAYCHAAVHHFGEFARTS